MSDPFPEQNDAAMRPVLSADPRLEAAIIDFFLADDGRLDERSRLLLSAVLGGIVAAIDAEVRRHAARLLSGRGAVRKAERLLANDTDVLARLTASGVLRDAELMEELIGRVRADLLAEALPVSVEQPGRPSLLVRLGELPDSVVAAAATALAREESRRADAGEQASASGGDLPAELHHRLVWWVAAAIRESAEPDPDIDRAIGEAAQRSLAAHDESERVEAVAVRLAAAIDPLPEEVPALLVEALGDRRLSLFTAVLARGIQVDFDAARALILDSAGEHLWPALRAVGLECAAIARIALSLAEADPRRDIERFADRLDQIAAIDGDAARAALAPLSLPRSFRAAIRALAGSAAS